MTVYITGTVLSLLLAWIGLSIPKSKRIWRVEKCYMARFFCFLSAIPLTFIMAVRCNVGTDYRTYQKIFADPYSRRVEAVFRRLLLSLKSLSDDPQILFIFCAVVICGAYFYVIYRESADPVYSILLFVITQDYFIAMNGMRQYLAGAIAMLSIPFIKKGQWLRAALIVLLAASIHTSALVYFLLMLLVRFPISPIPAVCIGMTGILFPETVEKAAAQIIVHIPYYSRRVSSDTGLFYSVGKIKPSLTVIFLAHFLLLSLVYKKVGTNKNLRMIYAAVTLSLIVLCMAGALPYNAYRVTWYMDVFIAIYIPEVIASLDPAWMRRTAAVGVAVCYGAYTTFGLLRGNHDVLPYHSIWGW